MVKKLKAFFENVKTWITQVLFGKIILPISLVFTYFLILGPTSLFAKVFFSSSLKKTSGSSESNWMNAYYAEDVESSKRQS